MKNKRGVFFSTDALVALIIILLAITITFPIIKYYNYETSIQTDLMKVLTNLKIGDINNNYVKELINEGKITDLNKSVLEQIGEFYSRDTGSAKTLANEILSKLNLDDNKDNIGLWFDGTLIYSKNTSSLENSKNIIVERQEISGIHEGGNVTGFSARSYLTGSLQTKYFYFGGYYGEGNISMRVDYHGNLTGVNMEITSNKNFSIYINGNGPYGSFGSSSEFIPQEFPLDAYMTYFNSGENIVKIVPNSGINNMSITGGFIKITYNTLDNYEENTEYNFPGIEGIINIYDGFYVPGNLNYMNISLHYNSNATIFLNIGNITVYRGNSSGSNTTVNINNTILSGLLNYNMLSMKTIPLRLGLNNISYVLSGKKDADVFSVNDISGSMGDCAIYGSVTAYNCTYDCCKNSGGTSCSGGRTCSYNNISCSSNECGNCPSGHQYESHHQIIQYQQQICIQTKLDLSKNATKLFIDSILNNSKDRIGLVGYSTSALDLDYQALSNNNVSLKNKVDSWSSGGGTCICCGINKAVNNLITNSSSDKFRSIVLMSDGQPTYYCNGFNDFNGSGTRGDSTGGTENTNDIQWAINASCNAWNNYGIKVYTIGFGSDVDNATMQAIAACGNGTYYFSNVSELANIYQQVANDIIQGSYNEQTVYVNGNYSTKLYPDSYIQFNYSRNSIPYGLITTFEKKFSDDYYGNFSIPENSKIIEAKVATYSGPRWTSNVEVNNYSIYNLSLYGTDFIKLGDPYLIYIPNSVINTTNLVKLNTGISIQNITLGSSSNKILYTIFNNMTSYNSTIYTVAEGCIWNLTFEDNTNSIIKVPKNYSGTNTCFYKPGDISVENENDAIEVTVLSLLRLLDIDSNGKLDTKLDENNLEIGVSQISGIPYSWSTEVQIRRWG